jgi:hypothetical protein
VEADVFALELWPVFHHLLGVLGKNNEYRGTVGQLLERLNSNRKDKGRSESRDWPGTPKGLAIELRRYAPSLRRVGVEIEWPGRINTGTKVVIHANFDAGKEGHRAA